MERFVILALRRQALFPALSNLIMWIVALAHQSKLPIRTLTVNELVDVYPCTVDDRDCVFRYCLFV